MRLKSSFDLSTHTLVFSSSLYRIATLAKWS